VGRIQPLDREQILDVTVRLSRSTDRNALSYRTIAAELEIDPASLYRYFANKKELINATVDRLWEGVVAQIDPSLPWRRGLEAGADLVFRMVDAHPAVMVEVAQRSTGGPGEYGLIELILDAIERSGLTGDAVVRAYAVFSGVALSLAANQAAFRLAGEDPDPEPTKAWVSEHLVPDPTRFPHVLHYAVPLMAVTIREVYDLAIANVLDNIEHLVAQG